MKPEEKYKLLRELLIEEILNTGSPEKPSASALKKMSDKRLVGCLSYNSIMAEQQCWKDDVINAITKLSPKTKTSYINTSVHLVNKLVKIAQETTKE